MKQIYLITALLSGFLCSAQPGYPNYSPPTNYTAVDSMFHSGAWNTQSDANVYPAIAIANPQIGSMNDRMVGISTGGVISVVPRTFNQEVNSRALKSTTITMNGVTKNLAANQTWTIGKSDVGLGNVDNTSDANKPISTATQTALNGKFNNPTGNASQVVLGNGTLGTLPTIASRSFNNSPGRSLVSVASAANGFQISSTRDASVSYSVSITTSLTLSGGSAGYVVLEICPTNSSTAANWIEISRVTSGQAGSGLVVGLAMNNSGGGALTGIVPSGYYVRQRSVNSTGTPTYSVNGQQEILL